MFQEVSLKSVCKIQNGFAFKSSEFMKHGIPLIRISSFNDGNVFINDKTKYLDPKYLQSKREFIVEKGDVLIALSGATTGKYGIYNLEQPSLLNQRVGVIKKGASDNMYGKYFYYYLSVLREEILRKAGGAAQPNISTRAIGEFKIPLPPLPIQKKIAAILDAADAYRQKTKALLEKYDELAQSLFLDMFGDPVRNEKGWEKVPLKELCSFEKISIKPEHIINGTTYLGLECIKKETGEIVEKFFVQAGEIKSNKFLFDKDHILYGKLRPYLNKVASPSFDGICSTDIIPIKPLYKKTTKEYIISLMRGKWFVSFADERSSGANLPRISPKELEKFMAICPPLDLQKEYSSKLQTIGFQKDQLKDILDRSNELFQALLQKAFKGELIK